MIAGTKADTVTAIIEKILSRNQVTEITLDMAANMGTSKNVFQMLRVTDRFHVQTSLEALQEIRIKYRWQSIDQENEAMAKGNKKFESGSAI
jgi:putative cell wall-binding protein